MTVADVPSDEAHIGELFRFALTYDRTDMNAYSLGSVEIGSLDASFSLTFLRTRLYFEQRRWNHYGRLPDETAESDIRKVIRLIRAKVESGA